jgi:predicted RNA-binding protein with RPS1 domain
METDTLEVEDRQESSSPIDGLERKKQYSGKVIKTTLAGAIIDIGLDTPGVVHISQLQKDPVNRVEDVIQVGQTVEVWVRRVVPNKHRIELTMVKPLDLDWRDIEPGMVAKGKVTRLEKFGAFVDIGAERPGLVHISEMAHAYVKDPADIVHEGDEVDVQVLKVSRRKRQIKLSMKALVEPPPQPEKPARSESRGEAHAEGRPEIRSEGRPERGEGRPESRGESRPERAEGRSERGERRSGRRERGSRPNAQIMEALQEDQPVVPTAMEMALREAMEKSKERQPEEDEKPRRKSAGANQELESILSRTLEHKVRSGK